MTIVLRHNEALELNRVEYHGSISFAELIALAEFNAAAPAWLNFDTLSLVSPGVDFRSVAFSELDALFSRYRVLFTPLHFHIMRRSAWICQSPAAEPHVQYWLKGRDTKNNGMSSDVRRFDTFADAGAWLVLTPPQAAALEHGEGFVEIVRFEIKPELGRAP